MKKLFLTLALLICVAASALDFAPGGSMFFGGNTQTSVVVGGGGALVWDDQFDSSISTETWGIFLDETAAKVSVAGGGLQIGGESRSRVYNESSDVPGLSRNIFGDFTAVVKFDFAPSEDGQAAGIIIRGIGSYDQQYTSPYSSLFKVYSGGQALVLRRDSRSGSTSSDAGATTFTNTTAYFKVARSGSSIEMWRSTDGNTWTGIASPTAPFAPTASGSVALQLFCCRWTASNPATATYDYCTITRP